MFLAPLLAGVAVHLCVRPFEIDHHTPRIIFAYPISFAGLVFYLITHRGLSLAESFLKTLTVTASFNAGLFGSILVYRAFFHRLHHFPGPFPAKLTRFHATRYTASGFRRHIVMENIHEEYGDFVRVGMRTPVRLECLILALNNPVGPREISIKRASAVGAIYGANSKCYRSTQYDQPSSDATKSSIVGTRDAEAHKRRKRAWERGLGFRGNHMHFLSSEHISIVTKTQIQL